MSQTSQFIFVICQNGAESATKSEVTSAHPELKLAFSRPGFITFKVDSTSAESTQPKLGPKFVLRSTLARTFGWSLGKLQSEDGQELIESVTKIAELANCQHVHIWQRDPFLPGRNGFEPGVSALSRQIGELIKNQEPVASHKILVNEFAKPDEKVFDVILVEPNEWWYGFHYANTVAGRWPGGAPQFDTSIEVFSRAYFKLKEALLWSGITILPTDLCAEIGSSPGGACQWLLEMGAGVLGIDPAEMEKEILEHENFIHIRKRGHEVRKKEFRDVDWLFADLNIAPKDTLDLVADIVGHDAGKNIKGIVLTLKLSDWSFVQQVPGLIIRVRELGFQVVKARQLAFNRQEFCLIGVKDKFVLREGKKNRSK